MREITPENAVEYLRETGRVPADRAVAVQALGWGVSNLVMRVEVAGQAPFVLKQSRARLRTEALWVSRLDRIWTEKAALELLASVLPAGTVPQVVFDDPNNYLFAMTCAPDDAVVWKAHLLAGEADPAIARRAGTILGAMHAETRDDPRLSGRLADTQIFDQLRIDPFYRRVAQVHPDLQPRLAALIASMTAPDNPDAPVFVHADFSPKNILVHALGLTLVDFETAHRGDPAFDLGFFLSHLLLKAFRAVPDPEPYLELTRQFWDAYRARTGLDTQHARIARSIWHTAACALARVDGKSPVDYLTPPTQDAVRRFARTLLLHDSLHHWDSLLQTAAREMQDTK